MQIARLSQDRLRELVAHFADARIAVVGDFFLDKYLFVDPQLEETSLETGLPAHQVVDGRIAPGAAGTVVSNLAALGAGALFAVGFTGEDGEGYDLRAGLQRLGCDTQHLHGALGRRTPTYLKPRDAGNAALAAEHSRYDTVNRSTTPQELQDRIVDSIDALLPEVDALIVMDQVEVADCGAITGAVRSAIGARAGGGGRDGQVVFWADSRRYVEAFRGVIVKPNQFEAMGRTPPGTGEVEVEEERLRGALEGLRKRNGAPVVATRGAAGMIVSDPVWTLVPGVGINGEVDPTGAGDSVSAGAVLALCAGAQLPEAAVVGNLVASLTVEQLATTGVAHVEQLPERLDLWHTQTEG